MNLETKLLKITALSRYRLMREIWRLPASPDTHKNLITKELTLLRNEIYEAITSSGTPTGVLYRDIVEGEGIPLIKKNICILAKSGISEECIADLNCVNIGYVRMCIKSLKEDYPELFG